MDNKDYLDKLIDLQKVVKRIDYQISELASEQRKYVLDYLSTLPFQKGDKVRTKSGDVIVIECLQNAFPLPVLESGIKVQFSFRRIKKDGEISKRVQQGYGIDYFNMKKKRLWFKEFYQRDPTDYSIVSFYHRQRRCEVILEEVGEYNLATYSLPRSYV